METLQAIRGRRSVRAYKSDSVPREVIAGVLDAARWAPSGSNRQRWRVTVLTGEPLKALADELVARGRERAQRNGGAQQASRPDPRAQALWEGLERVAQT
ncbi:MAG TPA: hypothetical protein GX702_07545, partial [Chloroflexi bacterium]|nr:hypothetical protein [Chloroflexota bacterium]